MTGTLFTLKFSLNRNKNLPELIPNVFSLSITGNLYKNRVNALHAAYLLHLKKIFCVCLQAICVFGKSLPESTEIGRKWPK